MKTRVLVLLAVIATAASLLPAGATFPFPVVPGDPYDYTRLHINHGECPRTPDSDLPQNFDCQGDWELTSYAPQPGDTSYDPTVANNPQELFGVEGSSTNLAWEVTTGRPDTVIAVMDSGILWDRPSLVNKMHLNMGELPLPCAGTCSDARGDGGLHDYDVNGDGVFNIADYEHDSRLTPHNGSYLTPDDLIHTFSDSIDQDDNGYADDIAGWDFFQHDNDAFDDTDYGHGTGEAGDSSAEIEKADTQCPNCMFMPLRVGDSFIAQINNWAEGVVYAVDNGVSLIQEALGTLNHTGFAQAAADYAYSHGVLIVASEADEEAGHHNYPAALNHTMVVNSVMQGIDPVQVPRTWLAFNGCTNWGGYTWMSVASGSCSSGATGNSAGIAGLVYSAARNAVQKGDIAPDASGRPLSSEEAKQIFRASADDINFSDPAAPFPPNNFVTSLPDTVRYVTTRDWDQITGWGRANADRAVRLVQRGAIPPQADMTSPRWWEILPTSGSIPIVGSVSAPRSTAGYTYEVQFAPGVQSAPWPVHDKWTTIASGSGSAPKTGVLANLNLAAVRRAINRAVPAYTPANDPTSRDLPEKDAFRVRVIVRDRRNATLDAASRIPDAIEQRQFFSHADPALMGGFPINLNADGGGSPAFADLNSDGGNELVLSDGNGFVHAFEPNGNEMGGFPVRSDLVPLPSTGDNGFTRGEISSQVYEPFLLGSPAIADLDGDGSPEIAVADHSGTVHVWRADGSLAWVRHSNPAYSRDPGCQEPGADLATCDAWGEHHARDSINTVDRAFTAHPAVADLDPSTTGPEVIVGSWDGHVYAWHADGTPVAGWPVLLRDPEKVESVDPVSHRVSFKGDAQPFYGRQVFGGVSVGDIDGDGFVEVLANVNEEYKETPNLSLRDPAMTAISLGGFVMDPANTRVYALRHDGTAHSGSETVSGLGDNAYVPGWPVKIALLTPELLPDVGAGSDGAPTIGQIDGKTVIATASIAGPLYVLNPDGTSYYGNQPGGGYITTGSAQAEFKNPQATDGPSIPSLGGAVWGRLAGPNSPMSLAMGTTGLKRLLDVVVPEQQLGAEDHVSAWDVRTGTFMPGFPAQMNDLQFFNTPAIADVDGDGFADVLQGSAMYDLQAYSIGGARPQGWPKFTGGWVVSTPGVGDFDGDGKVEVAMMTREGNLFVWRTKGSACQATEWPKYQHDLANTGNYTTPVARAPGC
ncbi:MAG: S8 family serine peptidase [Actinomycetota bacterium]